MFPLTANEPYIKETGERSTLGDMIGAGGGGGGYVLQPATESTLGGIKIGPGLFIDPNGTVSAQPDYGIYNDYVLGYAIFKPATNGYNIGICHAAVTSSASGSRVFGSEVYTLGSAFRPDLFNTLEFYNYLTEDVITNLKLELLYDGLESAADSAELAHPITDYDILVLQGCYNTSQTNEYNTTMFYVKPDITRTYWFGVKDRNSQYSGMLSFTDATHVSLSQSRRIKIYGVKL